MNKKEEKSLPANTAAAKASLWPQHIAISVRGLTSKPCIFFAIIAKWSHIPCTCLKTKLMQFSNVGITLLYYISYGLEQV